MDEDTGTLPVVLAAVGEARVEQIGAGEAPVWAIDSDRARLRLRWSPAVGLVLDRIDGRGVGLAGDPEAPVARLTLDRSVDAPPRLLGAEAEVDDGQDPAAVTLTVRAAVGEDKIAVHVRAFAGLAVLEQWLSVEVAEPATLTGVVPFHLGLMGVGAPTLATVAGVQRQGGWRPPAGPYTSFRLERRTLDGEPVRLESGLRSTWQENPWFALLDAAGGVFGGLDNSGRWQLDATRDADRDRTSVALAPSHRAPTLQPGQVWTSPVSFLGVFAGDLDAAAAAQHDYYRRVLSPPLPTDFPWVQSNTWFSYLCDLDAATLAREAEIAAELGVEVFYVDAGWWAASPRPRPGSPSDFTTGLGAWVENREKFPDGLRAFGGLVRARGMRFGLWVEPERVDLRTATTGTWRPEWLATTGDRFVRADWPPDTEAGWLCFGHPAVQAWALGWISELVDDLGLRWLKWDSNYWGVCDNPDHGHDPGDGEAAQLAGVHATLDALRARFPGLIIENCAGGGTRMDFGFARRSHVHWVSDASDPGHRVRFHLHGASHLMPPAVLNAWLVESPYENLRGTDHPEPVLRAMLRSRMLNAFGLSCRTVDWTERTRRICREEIAAYKGYRHLLRDGYVAHLLPQATLESPKLAAPDTWEAVQFAAADGAEAVVLAFRNAAVAAAIDLPLKGLDHDARYRVTDEQGGAETVPGAALLGRGLRVGVPPLASARYWVERVAGEAD